MRNFGTMLWKRKVLVVGITGTLSTLTATTLPSFAEEKTQSTAPGKCPVAFLWNWTSSEKPALPVGHPVISRDVLDEKPAIFNSSHYPNGVNSNFLNSDPNSCAETFAGPNGLFECESRQIKKYASNVVKTLQSYGLQEGSCVGDVGAGTGVLTRLFSKAVGPTGVVIAEELSGSFLTLLEEEKKQNPSMSNVILVQGTNKDINFPSDKKCDIIVVCDVYHHFEYPITTSRQIRNALKPNGKLVVIDFHRDDTKIPSRPKGWVMEHVRGTQDEFRKEIETAGFRFLAEPTIEGMTENYCMVFTPN